MLRLDPTVIAEAIAKCPRFGAGLGRALRRYTDIEKPTSIALQTFGPSVQARTFRRTTSHRSRAALVRVAADDGSDGR